MNTPTALPDNPNERDAWAAEYALGTLPGPVRQLVAEAWRHWSRVRCAMPPCAAASAAATWG